jgi:hypothetical protein
MSDEYKKNKLSLNPNENNRLRPFLESQLAVGLNRNCPYHASEGTYVAIYFPEGLDRNTPKFVYTLKDLTTEEEKQAEVNELAQACPNETILVGYQFIGTNEDEEGYYEDVISFCKEADVYRVNEGNANKLGTVSVGTPIKRYRPGVPKRIRENWDSDFARQKNYYPSHVFNPKEDLEDLNDNNLNHSGSSPDTPTV